MTYRIAIAGKGGSGKTTLATLIIYHLRKLGKTPVLAVDADPNANLHEGLGFSFSETVADLREEVLKSQMPPGMSKPDYINMRLQEAMVEKEGIDLLVMGRPEGRGCYCFANNLLRDYLAKISNNYPYVVMDNEAGMEHLSRRTTDDVDVLFIVSESSSLSLRSAARIQETAKRIELNIKKIFLVVNRLTNDLSLAQKEEIGKGQLELAGTIPEDSMINNLREAGRSLLEMPENSPAVKSMGTVLSAVTHCVT